MAEEVYERGKIEDDIKAGRPERYFDYIYETYGTIFQTGSVQSLETFRELLGKSSRSETNAAFFFSPKDFSQCYHRRLSAKYSQSSYPSWRR